MEEITSPTDEKSPSQEGLFCAPKAHATTSRLHKIFCSWAEKASTASGSPYAFIGAFSIIIIWAITGPIFQYSEIWQLVINTGTTIITFLLVFLIQNSQNRETRALQLKLDELIRATEGAQNRMISLEHLNEEELQDLYEQYDALANAARQQLEKVVD